MRFARGQWLVDRWQWGRAMTRARYASRLSPTKHSLTRPLVSLGRRPGQALVEFAVSATVLALLLVGVVDFARVFYFDVVASAAANQGALASATGAGNAAVVAAAQNSAPAWMRARLDIQVIPATCTLRVASPAPVWTTVDVRYSFTPITPMMTTIWRAARGTEPFRRSASLRMRSDCL